MLYYSPWKGRERHLWHKHSCEGCLPGRCIRTRTVPFLLPISAGVVGCEIRLDERNDQLICKHFLKESFSNLWNPPESTGIHQSLLICVSSAGSFGGVLQVMALACVQLDGRIGHVPFFCCRRCRCAGEMMRGWMDDKHPT